MSPNKNADIGKQWTRDDYLDLWKYFQSRADQLKDEMFKTLTWVIGFAAAILGFIVNNFVDLDPAAHISHKGAAVIFCLVGLVICIYAAFLLSEFAHHISRNWNRADQCKANVPGLIDIIKSPSSSSDRTSIPIWWRIGGVVILFGMAFVSGLLVFIMCPIGG